ncbi:MAG: hypothetical protein IGS48_23935 [Oscillatoriales cyanobacterium C42_A2020_001]|nr:hypothetical protein [Leptolyngbyaceae cyanobacterium C42_A2020_001]
MEEHQARRQPPQSYPVSHNLAQQPYPIADQDEMPLEEEANVVPMPMKQRSASQSPQAALGSIAEDPLTPRSSTKRKQSGSGKSRAAANKSKPAASYRPPQSPKHQPFADELQHLEDLADRINQILVERARKKAWMEQSQAMSFGAEVDPASIQQQMRSPKFQPDDLQTSLEQEATDDLKQQAKRIRQRLSQLELMMDEADTPPAPPHRQTGYRDRSYPQPSEQSYPQPSAYSYPQPHPHHPNPFDPVRQRYDYEAWRANEELRQLVSQEQSYGQSESSRDRPRQQTYERQSYQRQSYEQPPFEPVVRRSLSHLRRLPLWRFFELPEEPMERLKDAVVWVGIAAIARLASHHLLSSLPFLSPVFTLMMIAPAALAIFLALFVPKTGWVPFYRLFLVMLGLFIGGKFF